jgi:hypothetical protein
MRSLAWLGATCALACNGTVSVTFFTGPQEFEVSVDELAPPEELRDPSNDTIRSVPCGPEGMCPPSDDVVVLTCESNVCDPAAQTIEVPIGGVIDVDALLADTREIGVSRVESYSFDEVRYEISLNTLTMPVGPVAVYWGPESATGIDSALGVMPFGTLPTIEAGQMPQGTMDLDAAGSAALGDYLVGGGARIRFFAETMADLDPGEPFPGSSVRGSVNLTITAVSRVID